MGQSGSQVRSEDDDSSEVGCCGCSKVEKERIEPKKNLEFGVTQGDIVEIPQNSNKFGVVPENIVDIPLISNSFTVKNNIGMLLVEKECKIFVCGDIEGDYARFHGSFLRAFGDDCIDEKGYLEKVNDNVLIFLGDIIDNLSDESRIGDNKKILEFISKNYDKIAHYDLNTPYTTITHDNFDDIKSEIKNRKLSRRITPGSVIFIKGNADDDIINDFVDHANLERFTIGQGRYTHNMGLYEPLAFQKIIMFSTIFLCDVLHVINSYTYDELVLTHYDPRNKRNQLKISIIHGHDQKPTIINDALYNTSNIPTKDYSLDCSRQNALYLLEVNSDQNGLADPATIQASGFKKK